MVNLVVQPDQTLKVVWDGKKGGGSLYFVMAAGNAENANKLTGDELFAVVISAKHNPFPMGQGAEYYQLVLEKVRSGEFKMTNEQKAAPVGRWRKAVVEAAGSGCNAPMDTYLSIAARGK